MAMAVYAILCVPETKNIPLESIHMLFEGNIISGATRDTIPRFSRAKTLKAHSHVRDEDVEKDIYKAAMQAKAGTAHVESANLSSTRA